MEEYDEIHVTLVIGQFNSHFLLPEVKEMEDDKHVVRVRFLCSASSCAVGSFVFHS